MIRLDDIRARWLNSADCHGESICEQACDDICSLLMEIDMLRAWVGDLQSGMYVNCVYCGHRYGPNETTPVSMADALKAHIEQCPKHPMSALKAENARLQAEIDRTA